MSAMQAFASDFPTLTLLILGTIGACMGSFLTLVTYRLPREEKIGATRSRCPHCQTALRARDLVPVLSWSLARGRCRHCKTPISPRYPLTELASASACIGMFWLFGLTPASLCLMGLMLAVIALIITDFEHRIILDEVQVAVFFLGLLYGTAQSTPLTSLLGGALGGLLIGLALKYGFLLFTRRDGLGFGDVKFLLACGPWLADPKAFVPFLFYAGILGIVTSLFWRARGGEAEFPFGPALALSLITCVVWPETVSGFFSVYGLVQTP